MRSEEGGGFRKEGDGGEGKKKEKRTRKKCSEARVTHNPIPTPLIYSLDFLCIFQRKNGFSTKFGVFSDIFSFPRKCDKRANFSKF